MASNLEFVEVSLVLTLFDWLYLSDSFHIWFMINVATPNFRLDCCDSSIRSFSSKGIQCTKILSIHKSNSMLCFG